LAPKLPASGSVSRNCFVSLIRSGPRMSPEIQIRPMAPADLARVMKIERSLAHAPHWPPSTWLTLLQPESTPRRIALLAANSTTNATLGFAVASLLPPQAELETIAVAVEAQRLGIARQLFAALFTQLRAAQVMEARLEVRASNHPAMAFYRALGFVQSGLRPRYYADPQEDAVLFTLNLA
jgi:[ribosomal protein S18]-alanine N-acetyltransferase